MALPQTLKLLYGVEPARIASGTTSAPAIEPYIQAPLYPSRDWFSNEAADAAPKALRLFPGGRVAGIVAPANRCLIDGTGECWMVPRPTDGRGSALCTPDEDGPDNDYYIAHYGSGGTVCEDGSVISTGTIAGTGGHANPFAPIGQVKDHYDNTDWQTGRFRFVWSDTAGDGIGGVVAVGSLWPEVTERQLAGIRASACSVDYRYVIDEAQYRLIGTCLVNVGGLPPRYASAIEQGMVLTPESLNDLVREVGMARVASAGLMLHAVPRTVFAVPSVPAPAVASEDPLMSMPNATTVASTDTPAAESAPPATPEEHAGHAPGCTCQTAPAMTAAAGDATTEGADDATAAAPTTDAVEEPAAIEPTETQPARTAATLLVDASPVSDIPGAPSYRWNDQITWTSNGTTMVGAFSDVLRGWDNTAYVSVIPEVDGELDYGGAVVIPASETTATGKLYETINPKDLPSNAVIPATPELLEAIEDAQELRWMIEDQAYEISYCCSASGPRIPLERLPIGKATTAHDLALTKLAAAHVESMAELNAKMAAVSGGMEALERQRLQDELASLTS